MKTLVIDSIKKHKIFTDPIRQDILSVYRQLGTPQTVKMISDVLNTPHSKIHYHVKKLLEIEALNLVKTDMINGITVKYYALTFDNVTQPGHSWVTASEPEPSQIPPAGFHRQALSLLPWPFHLSEPH